MVYLQINNTDDELNAQLRRIPAADTLLELSGSWLGDESAAETVETIRADRRNSTRLADGF